jgi:hypothetical protein
MSNSTIPNGLAIFFTIATLIAPSGLKSSEGEAATAE